MLSSVGEESREIMLLHKRLFGSKVNPRILDQFVQDGIKGRFAFSLSKRLVQFVHGLDQFLVLLVENGNVHAESFGPTEGSSGDRHFSLALRIFIAGGSVQDHQGRYLPLSWKGANPGPEQNQAYDPSRAASKPTSLACAWLLDAGRRIFPRLRQGRSQSGFHQGRCSRRRRTEPRRLSPRDWSHHAPAPWFAESRHLLLAADYPAPDSLRHHSPCGFDS